MEATIRTVDLAKTYDGGTVALDGLTVEVPSGQFCCLLGPNGAGKTTTISILFGFILPTRGHAEVCGHDVVTESIAARAAMAFVPERVALYGELTAEQNVVLFAELGGVTGNLADRSREALRRMGLPDSAIRRRVGEFSKGMRQKVALAAALVRDCGVVVLDEPTSGLDPEAATMLMRHLRELADGGTTIFMSTHDIFRVDELADRVLLLHRGRLVRDLGRDELGRGQLQEVYMDVVREGVASSS